MNRPPSPQRNLQLDLLRFVAILLVFFRHTPQWSLQSSPKILQALQRGGWAGVDLFFVLSGFLIGGLLFLEHKRYGEIRLSRFYARRALKLYPAFYVCIFIAMIVHLLKGDVSHIALFKGFIGEALFLQNYLANILGYTWSLAVEEHFYIALPLLLVFLSKPPADQTRTNRFANILWIYPSCALMTLAMRSYLAFSRPFSLKYLLETHLRFDSLLVGVALAYLYQDRGESFLRITKQWRWPLVAIGVAAFLPPMLFDIDTSRAMYTLGLLALSLGGAALIAGFLTFNIPTTKPILFLATLGAFSYSIYLFHGPLFELGAKVARRIFLNPGGNRVAAFQYSFAIAIGILAGKLIEFPALRFRDQFFPSRTGTPVQRDGEQGIIGQSPRSPTERLEA